MQEVFLFTEEKTKREQPAYGLAAGLVA